MRACATCGTANGEGAKFCQECGTPISAPEEARRRLVTALFCDLVGSTELGERLDPEVLRRLLDRYYEAMRTVIERHGGVVEKFIGDAVVGTFGVPVAHEDDTLRAVRAALDMRGASAGIDPNAPLQVRIAINVGEALADEAAAKQGRLAGDVFNTAARLQAAAEPGDVVVSDAAAGMVRASVELEPLDAIAAKGKSEPVRAYRVLGVRPSPTRFDTPMVGRDRALAKLVDALDDAIDVDACVLVSILSPPGVGKSRLAEAFVEAVRDRARILVAQTPSYGDGVTFAPLAELLAQAAELPSGDAEEVAAAIRRRLAGEPDGASVGDRLAQVLGVGEALAADMAWAVRRLLEVLADERPLVVVLEDMHWAEAPMLDLVDQVVERLHGPALVLCLARPELLEQRPTWGAGKLRSATTTLPPLPEADSRRLAELLLGTGAPGPVLDRVCETAEGNPLYLEQLAAMLADQGLMVDGRWAGPDRADVEIPATLQALLAARFDRLDPVARVILERATVEGRRFRTAALEVLAPEVGTEGVQTAIASLDRRGLVQPEDEAAGRWRFGHSLVREAAYRGLSKELRAELHERLADWMAQADADQPNVDESVARHLERALRLREELGEHDDRSASLALRAGELFADAGTRAFAALDLVTSRDLLGRAAALLPSASARRLDILPNLGVALTETGSPQETEALLGEGVATARAAGSEREALRATIQLLSNRVYRDPTQAEVVSAIAEAEAAAEALEALGDDVGLAEAAIALEYLEFMRGCVAAQLEWTLRGLRHALTAGRLREATQAAADVVGASWNGPTPLHRLSALADERVLPLDDPISLGTGHALMALGALGAGDGSGFREQDRRRREVVERHGLTWLGATHDLVIGNAQIWTGDAEDAERRLRDARDVLSALGDIWWISSLDSSLCLAVGAQDRAREFLRLADIFLASVPVIDPQVVVRRGLLVARAQLLRGSAADGEVAVRRGLQLAGETDLVPDHADAWLTLADVLDARGQIDEAATARGEALELLRAKGYLAAIARLTG